MKFSFENLVIFNMFAQNIDCGYTLKPPRRGGSNEYPQSMVGIPLQTPVFYIYIKWDSMGYAFHGHVFLMITLKGSIRPWQYSH